MVKSTMNAFKCSSMFSTASAVIIIIMGIISLAISIWMITTNNWGTIFSYQINLMCTFMIVAGCLLIIGGIYGIWATHAKSNTHLSGYFGVMILCSLLLLVAAVLGVALPWRVIVGGCGSPIYPVISGLNGTATQAINRLCQSSCQCYADLNNNPNMTTGYVISSTLQSLPVKAQKCPNWIQTAYDDLMANIQNQFSCSGWCPGTRGIFYKFNDLNKGIPSSTCFQATVSWFQKFSKAIAICGFLFGGLIIILLGFVWWHLCELVDLQTQRILLIMGKYPPTSPPVMNLSQNNIYEQSNIQLPISQPSSPKQVMYVSNPFGQPQPQIVQPVSPFIQPQPQPLTYQLPPTSIQYSPFPQLNPTISYQQQTFPQQSIIYR